MKKCILLIVFLCLPAGAAYAQAGCTYDKNGYREFEHSTTRVDISAGKVRQLKGKIANIVRGESVFPMMRVIAYRRVNGREIYIGSQVVDRNGWFCFGGLPDGRYRLKIGGVIVWDNAEVDLTIRHADKKAVKDILISLSMAI